MTDPELAADINWATGRDDAAQLISPLPLSHEYRIRECIRRYRWGEGILSRGDVTCGKRKEKERKRETDNRQTVVVVLIRVNTIVNEALHILQSPLKRGLAH